MSHALGAEDSKPPEPSPAGLLFVPVRSGPAGCITTFFRTPLGRRTAVGFTSAHKLTSTLGADQRWIKLSESALRGLASPLGVTTLTVDPRFAAPASSAAESTVVRPPDGSGPGHDRALHPAGIRRIAVAAALGTCLNLLIV